MASDYFELKIVTPIGVALEETVVSVTLPSSNGEMGILPQHTQYTGLLGTGVLSFVTQNGGKAEQYVISGGFCTFSENILTVLTDRFDRPQSIDKGEYFKDKQSLISTIEAGETNNPDFYYAVEGLRRIEAMERLI